MNVHRKDSHAKQVEAWVNKNAKSVSKKDLSHLYAKAIQAIERRSLATLSGVTVLVVVDRAIYETKEKFPLLCLVKSKAEGIDFSAIFKKTDVNSDDLNNSLRELLVCLLNIFGNITADILTIPLHAELMEVTIEQIT